MTATEVVDWFDAKKCGKNNKFVEVYNEGEGEGEDKKPIIKYKKETIENAINTIIINKLNAEEKQIEDIALNVISNYRSKLLEHMQTAIIKEITKDLEEKLKTINSENITEKIVTANVKNFKDLLSEHGDKSSNETYKNLLNFAKICKAKEAKEAEEAAKKKAAKEKAEGGKPKRKKYTRKSHKKPNKQKTRRFKGVKGGQNDDEKCLDVGAICETVTSIIKKQADKFETETVKEFKTETVKELENSEDPVIVKLKEKLEKVCLDKTNEVLDDFSKQAIDISSLNEIFKMLIFEITNIVSSNMKNLDKTICKSENDS